MSFAFAPSPQVVIPIRGSADTYPVHRIYCVGRNYNDHVVEMGGVVGRDPPFFFAKPADAIVLDGNVPYPARTQDFHHELELVIALGPDAKIFGYAVGIDMTRRDLQAGAKKLGRAWETSKSFDYSAPISEIAPITETGELTKAAMFLEVNGARRQSSDISQMIWNANEIIAELGTYFKLQQGDIIFTGTPSGVGAVQRGDKIVASIEGIGRVEVLIA